MRPKHEERSCGDFRVSKQVFLALENLRTVRWNEMGPQAERLSVGGPLAVDCRGKPIGDNLSYGRVAKG